METYSYGIYKRLTNNHLTQFYDQVRQLMTHYQFREAIKMINKAIDYGKKRSSHWDLIVLQLIKREIELYYGIIYFPLRTFDVWIESWNQFPQSIFILKIHLNNNEQQTNFVGRKILSNLYIENKIPELHCSQIRSSMLLGILHQTHSTLSALTIYYYPLQFHEKQCLFNQILCNNQQSTTEIIYPFRLLHPTTHTELQSEPDGWLLTEEMVDQLAQGETHLRNYSIEIIEKFKDILPEHPIIYDPACSTGQFLFTMKCSFPNISTIGQDLSESMIEYVRKHHHADETLHKDANEWPFTDRQVDMAFVRFLNSEVVTTSMASSLFEKIVKRVKSNGKLIVFGHTPVLLSSDDFLLNNSVVIDQCIGITTDHCGISLFQYYILTVK